MTENCREFLPTFQLAISDWCTVTPCHKPIADLGCLFSIRNRKMCG